MFVQQQTIFTPTELNTIDMNNTTYLNENVTNGSILALTSASNTQGLAWDYNWHLIILIAMGLLFPTVLVGVGIWYWRNRTHRLRRQHSLPLAVNDFIETTKIQEKRLSSSPNKAPPVPPRPTAYTTILGKVEYRSNL